MPTPRNQQGFKCGLIGIGMAVGICWSSGGWVICGRVDSPPALEHPRMVGKEEGDGSRWNEC